MNRYNSVSDDFYVNMNLATEIESFPAARETVLHFFERIQKKYPSMCGSSTAETTRFRPRRGEGAGGTIAGADGREPPCLFSVQVNPGQRRYGPRACTSWCSSWPRFLLSVSPLDCEALDLLFGLRFTYRGNHNQLVARGAWESAQQPRGCVIDMPGGTVINYEAVDHACRWTRNVARRSG